MMVTRRLNTSSAARCLRSATRAPGGCSGRTSSTGTTCQQTLFCRVAQYCHPHQAVSAKCPFVFIRGFLTKTVAAYTDGGFAGISGDAASVCHANGQCDPLINNQNIQEWKALRIGLLGTCQVFEPEELLISRLPAIRFAQKNGIKASLYCSVREAVDTHKHPSFDSACDYRNFTDSLIHDEDGKIIPCWSGVSASNDPNLSYGKFLFERITSWITKHEL